VNEDVYLANPVATAYMQSDGSPLVTALGCVLTDNFDGTYNIYKANAFTANIVEGMYIYITAVVGFLNSADVYYKVEGKVDNSNITVKYLALAEFDEFWEDDTIDIEIGGVAPVNNAAALQNELDFLGSRNSGMYNLALDIRCNDDGTLTDLSASIDFDAFTPSITKPHRFTCTNSDFENDGTEVSFRASASMAGQGLFEISDSYFTFSNVVLDANNNADNPFRIITTSTDRGDLYNCTLKNGTSNGFYSVSASDYWRFIGCTVKDNGARGFGGSTTYATIKDCTITGNTNGGVQFSTDTGIVVDHCVITGNVHGVIIAGDYFCISNNTIGYQTGGSGVIITTAADHGMIYNNTVTDVPAWGYYFYDPIWDNCTIFANNHAYDCDTALAANDGVDLSDAEFLAFGAGNITGDPGLADPGNDEYTPTASSPLIGAGVGGELIGALSPVSGGGRIMRERRHNV